MSLRGVDLGDDGRGWWRQKRGVAGKFGAGAGTWWENRGGKIETNRLTFCVNLTLFQGLHGRAIFLGDRKGVCKISNYIPGKASRGGEL